MKELHVLSGFAHGVLASLHFLGVLYGLRRKQWLDTAVHATALAFSVKATIHHIEEAKNTPGGGA